MNKYKITSIVLSLSFIIIVLGLIQYSDLEKNKTNLKRFIPISGHSSNDSDFINKIVKFDELTYTQEEYEELSLSEELVDNRDTLRIYCQYGIICIGDKDFKLVTFDGNELETKDNGMSKLDNTNIQQIVTPLSQKTKQNKTKTYYDTDALNKITIMQNELSKEPMIGSFDELYNINIKNSEASSIKQQTYINIITNIINGDTETYNLKRKYISEAVMKSEGIEFIRGYVDESSIICGKSDYKLEYFDLLYTVITVDDIRYHVIFEIDNTQKIFDIDILTFNSE